jgi:outer membrane protein assembly factor BamB
VSLSRPVSRPNARLPRRARLALAALLLGLALAASPVTRAADGGDWPMWGGTHVRNMVSAMRGAPVTWDIQAKKNVRWVAALGSQSYGNPVVAGGKVFVGTNNEGLRDPKQAGDRGVLMAFDEKTGAFLWQITHEKLAAGRVNDWPYQGVASSPLVEGDRIYYVSNRCELVAADTEGSRARPTATWSGSST